MLFTIESKYSWTLPFALIAGFLGVIFWGIVVFSERLSALLYFCQNVVMFQITQNPALLILISSLGILLIIGLVKMARFLFKEIVHVRTIKVYLRFLCSKRSTDFCLIEAPDPMAFTVGFFKPVVIYTTALEKVLNNKELESVLSHELAHKAKRDPLRRLLGRAIAELLFFVPLLADLAKNLSWHQEARADRMAILKHGKENLISGMKKLMLNQLEPDLGATVCPLMGSTERLKNLQSGRNNFSFNFSWKKLVFSIVFFIFAAAMLVFSPQAQAATTGFPESVCQAAYNQTEGLDVGGHLMSVQTIQWNELTYSTLIFTNNENN